MISISRINPRGLVSFCCDIVATVLNLSLYYVGHNVGLHGILLSVVYQ